MKRKAAKIAKEAAKAILYELSKIRCCMVATAAGTTADRRKITIVAGLVKCFIAATIIYQDSSNKRNKTVIERRRRETPASDHDSRN